jgi:hypothetical protein
MAGACDAKASLRTRLPVLLLASKNFPDSHSVILGLLKDLVRHNSAIITKLYIAIYGGDANSVMRSTRKATASLTSCI